MTQKKKKKALRRELIIGGGAMVILWPLILFALVGAAGAIVVGAVMAPQMSDSIFLTMLAVYGTLLALLIVFGYRFGARLIAVIRRMRNIRQEQRRIREVTRAYVVEPTAAVDELADDSEREMSPRRLTRR